MEDSIIARIPLFERMSPEEREELRGMMSQTTLRVVKFYSMKVTPATAYTSCSPAR